MGPLHGVVSDDDDDDDDDDDVGMPLNRLYSNWMTSSDVFILIGWCGNGVDNVHVLVVMDSYAIDAITG